MPEVTFINRDDDGLFIKELAQQSTKPQPLFIVKRISILYICLLKTLVLKLESLFHNLSNDQWSRNLFFRHYIQKMRVNLITSQLIDTCIIKERRHCLNQCRVLAFSNLLLELNTSFSLSDDLFNHLLSESILIELFLFRFLFLMSSLWDSASHLKLSHVSLEFLNYLSNLLRTQP